jgi:deoxyadenosine/deoxycytidine kinase
MVYNQFFPGHFFPGHVFLDVSSPTYLQRINVRGRNGSEELTPNLIEGVQKKYRFFEHVKTIK